MNVSNLVALEAYYESAMLGHAVDPTKPPRFAYSLVLLSRRESARSCIPLPQAQELISELVRRVTEEHGDRAPLFIDDTVSRTPENPVVRLIV